MSKKTLNITIDDLVNKFKLYNESVDDEDLIRRAYAYAEEKHFGQKRISGDDYILHPLNVAMILTDISADAKCLAAALLHDTIEDSDATKEEIEELFGSEVALLVDGVTKINKINFTSDSEASAAYQRKILVGLSEDVRVIIIKLADRLHNMRTIDVLSEAKQKKKAKETLEILTPVAHRLGISKLKSELEDLSLRYLKPDAYFDIVEKLNQKKTERDEAVNKMLNEVSELLNEHNIPHEIKGRSKSIYSIYNKMSKGKRFDDIYDILALRVFVDTEQECYLALGLIHSKYKPVPKRFKDYIAMPKTNLYQSLHTTVFGIDGELFEIQIRTYDMDKIAEYGIASHWSYKEHKDGSKALQDSTEQKLQIFRNIIELNEDSASSEEFVSSVKKDILSNDVIYVYTPKGDVLELPKDSTPVDFAYRIHTDLGDKLIGAIVNDVAVPLDYKLQNNDIVKVRTGSNSTPNMEWLKFVKTSHARNKIKSFFSKQEKDIYIEKGKTILQNELRRRHLSFDENLKEENVKKILSDLKLESLDEVYFTIGTLRYTPSYIINLTTDSKKDVTDLYLEHLNNVRPSSNSKSLVLVDNQDNILSNLAKCCNPVLGDKIVGVITKGDGVSVHRIDCPNIKGEHLHFVNVEWKYLEDNYYTKIKIYTDNLANHLLDIVSKSSTSDVYIDEVKTKDYKDGNLYELTLKVSNITKLDNYMNSLLAYKFVKKVERV